MARSLGESSPFILAALLVGLFVGWLLWGRNRTGRRPAAPGVAAGTAPSTVTAAAESKPAAVAAPVVAAHQEPASPSRPASGRTPQGDGESAPQSEEESEPNTRADLGTRREPDSTEQPGADRKPRPVAEPGSRPVPVTVPVTAAVTAAESSARPDAPAVTEDAAVATPEAAVVTPEAGVGPSAAAVTPAPAQPAGVSTSGPIDDLARVEGIGPKITAALVAAGIRSFRDLGGSDVETLRAALRSAGLRFVPSLPSWPEQARLLADDDTAGLAALTDRLIAGREPAADVASSPAVASRPEPEPSSEAVPDEPTASSNGSAARPRPSTPPDDLKRIEGIGPKMASALNAAGITTFEELAAADETTIRAAISAGGLRFAPSLVTWARQARLLARGDEQGFDDITGHLVAGRETGRG